MAQPTFDPSLKAMVEAGPGDWTVFAGQPAAPTEVIDSDIATVSGAADKVLRVAAERPYLLHLEFVSGHDASTLPVLLNKRNILLEDRHELPVRTVVILLQAAADSPALTGVRERRFPDEEPYNVFRYEVIRVWRIPAALLLAGGLGTLALAPISAVTDAEIPGIIQQMRKRLHRRDAGRLDERIWPATRVLLGLRHPADLVNVLMQGVQSMKESSTYREIVEEGRIEGRIEGTLEAYHKILLELGSDRLGQPSKRIQATLAKIADLKRLESLIKRVQKVESWKALLADAPLTEE
jgi:predicted transposase YdaD